jgi:predicted lysophospholipase L1 biosynthesis ABC-type transport system permease subunit
MSLPAGSLITLLLAGASLLVPALEQGRARRRPLAVLAASGVPRSTLAWSLLWQNAIPFLLAMVVAVATGAGLGVLLLRVLAQPVALDFAGMGVPAGASVFLVLLVTVLTLPSLRRATGALGLRTE